MNYRNEIFKVLFATFIIILIGSVQINAIQFPPDLPDPDPEPDPDTDPIVEVTHTFTVYVKYVSGEAASNIKVNFLFAYSRLEDTIPLDSIDHYTDSSGKVSAQYTSFIGIYTAYASAQAIYEGVESITNRFAMNVVDQTAILILRTQLTFTISAYDRGINRYVTTAYVEFYKSTDNNNWIYVDRISTGISGASCNFIVSTIGRLYVRGDVRFSDGYETSSPVVRLYTSLSLIVFAPEADESSVWGVSGDHSWDSSDYGSSRITYDTNYDYSTGAFILKHQIEAWDYLIFNVDVVLFDEVVYEFQANRGGHYTFNIPINVKGTQWTKTGEASYSISGYRTSTYFHSREVYQDILGQSFYNDWHPSTLNFEDSAIFSEDLYLRCGETFQIIFTLNMYVKSLGFFNFLTGFHYSTDSRTIDFSGPYSGCFFYPMEVDWEPFS